MYNAREMSPTPKDERVVIRVAEADVATWRAAAEKQRMTLSDWIRRQCYAAIADGAKPKKR